MQITRILYIGALLMSVSGCQCCALTERYQDHIDHIADKQPHLDRFYHPGLDLTRIGYPDWCQNSFNRWLYGDCCCRDTRCQPAYIHNPMYDPVQYSPTRNEAIQMPAVVEPTIAPKKDTGPDDTNSDPSMPKGIPDPKQLELGDTLPPLPTPAPAPAPVPNLPLPPPVE